jgi:hypothetical protein
MDHWPWEVTSRAPTAGLGSHGPLAMGGDRAHQSLACRRSRCRGFVVLLTGGVGGLEESVLTLTGWCVSVESAGGGAKQQRRVALGEVMLRARTRLV